ncbi:hypothetical protein IAT38_001407 [Cryptococcus sp. DSM 104549]
MLDLLTQRSEGFRLDTDTTDADTRHQSSPAPTNSSPAEPEENPAPAAKPDKAVKHPFQNGEKGKDAAGTYFLDGEMRHTAEVRSAQPSVVPTFTLSEILGKHEESSLIIGAGNHLVEDWMSKILPDPKVVPTIMVHSDDEVKESNLHKVTATPKGMVLLYPPNCPAKLKQQSHMKWLWLSITNLVKQRRSFRPFGWTIIENTAFVQDFLPSSSSSQFSSYNNTPSSDFPRQFQDLGSRQVPSGAERAGETPALGGYAREWLAEFITLCEGDRLRAPLPRNLRESPLAISILHPTAEAVRATMSKSEHKAHLKGGGKGFLDTTRRSFCAPEFKRGPLVMGRSSMMAATLRKSGRHNTLGSVSGNSEPVATRGWIYMGSHNLSVSAWGWTKILGRGGGLVLTMKNNELGIILPLGTCADNLPP